MIVLMKENNILNSADGLQGFYDGLTESGKAFILNDSLLHGGFSGGERSRVLNVRCS